MLFFRLALAFYFLGTVFYLSYLVSKKETLTKLSFAVTGFGFLSHSLALFGRAFEAGYIPLTNLHEAMSFFSWALVLAFLLIEYQYRLHVLGSFLLPLSFISLISAAALPDEIRKLDPLLQSAWLGIHTVLAILGSVAFSMAFVAGLMYLIQERFLKSKKFNAVYFKLPSLDVLDDLNYRAIFLGFPLLTLGIISGSIWAEYAWGSFWSKDPKQMWALITWLFYGVMLVGRLTMGWRAKRAAYLAIIGFIGVVFTFIGVNFLFHGKHTFL
ncbi:MAG: c-type cytochrome biogenesis protein CcsB [Nitrospirae bacterium]|nr:c-type cytochrome biogenesis protein CcsB [Nitrospirota bacterium]